MIERLFTLLILPFLPFQVSIQNARGDHSSLPLLNQIRLYQFVCIDTVAAKKTASLFQTPISRPPVVTQVWFNTLQKPFEELYTIILFLILYICFQQDKIMAEGNPLLSLYIVFLEISIAYFHIFGLRTCKIEGINLG